MNDRKQLLTRLASRIHYLLRWKTVSCKIVINALDTLQATISSNLTDLHRYDQAMFLEFVPCINNRKQAGALFTGGWTLCSNGSLALGPSTIFYRCLSGDFYNLYDRNWAAQCGAIHLSAHQASPEVVNEVPPAAGGAAPKPAPAPDAPVTTTTPVVVVPPSTPTPTDAPATSGSSVPASVSPVSTPPAAAGNGTLGPVVIPSPAPPVDPAQAGTGNMVHVGTAAGSSIAAVLALFALVMV
jgi:hypothetical protein